MPFAPDTRLLAGSCPSRRSPRAAAYAPAGPPCTAGGARPTWHTGTRRRSAGLRRLAGSLLLAVALPGAAAATAGPPDVPCRSRTLDAEAAAASAAVPHVVAPADGATLHGAGARLAWTRDAGPRLRLHVARDDAFADLVVDSDVSGTDETLVALPPGEWRWRIAVLRPGARSAADIASCSEARRFLLRPIPAAPSPEAPRLRDGVLTLAWQPGAPGDEAYEAELARDPMFTDIVARHAGPEPRMAVRDPAVGTLWLRVRTVDATGYAGPYGQAHPIDVPRPRWWQVLPPLTMLWWMLLL